MCLEIIFLWERPDSGRRIYVFLSSLDASFESLEMYIKKLLRGYR